MARCFPSFLFSWKKERLTHMNSFNELKANGLVVKMHMADFEVASRTAIRNVFGNVAVKCCRFHYTQAVMRRTKMIGLERAYRSSEFVNTTIRRLFGLAFVDTTEVHSAVRAVESAIEQFQDSAVRDRLSELMRYFNTTWMVMFKPDE